MARASFLAAQPQLLDTRRLPGPVEVTDPVERDVYDRLVSFMQRKHPEADLSWLMLRRDDQGVFVSIDDADAGVPYYHLAPWQPNCDGLEWQMLDCQAGDRRLAHAGSLIALARMVTGHSMSSLSSQSFH